uniref:Secreted protein n=1 Tax=Rhipicephalus appendiculatus TaxID=34631 RepID=A0A131YC78_RHIAP
MHPNHAALFLLSLLSPSAFLLMFPRLPCLLSSSLCIYFQLSSTVLRLSPRSSCLCEQIACCLTPMTCDELRSGAVKSFHTLDVH